MTLTELVRAVYLKATGKVQELSFSDGKYQKILQIANQQIDTWESSTNVDWVSLYDRAYSVGSVSATDTYPLDEEVRKLSDTRGDYVRVTAIDGRVVHFTIVPPDELQRYDEASTVCAQIGSNLVFRKAFSADDPLLGGSITVPCYVHAEHLERENDEVPVDIPQWLVLASAAEYVRNDITKQNQYPNLVQEANTILDKMVENNEAQSSIVYAPFKTAGRSW